MRANTDEHHRIRFLGLTDGRSAGARRFKTLLDSIVSDAGGAARLTTAGMQLARTAAGLALTLERLDSQLARGDPVDPVSYARCAGAFARALTKLDIQYHAKAKKADDPLNDYLERRRA